MPGVSLQRSSNFIHEGEPFSSAIIATGSIMLIGPAYRQNVVCVFGEKITVPINLLVAGKPTGASKFVKVGAYERFRGPGRGE